MLLHKLRLKCFLVLQSDSQENRNEENLIFYCKYFIPLWTVKCWLLSPTFKQCELVHFHFFFLLSSEEQTVRWATRAIGTNTPALLCNVLKPGGVWTHLVCLCGSIIPFYMIFFINVYYSFNLVALSCYIPGKLDLHKRTAYKVFIFPCLYLLRSLRM